MIYKHKNNRDIDMGATIPNLHIDLEKAVENNVIRDTGVIPEFNGIENTTDVGACVRDTFAAIDEQRAIESKMRSLQYQQTKHDITQTQTQTQTQPAEQA